MAKVYGTHTIELAPGVQEQELEQFMLNEAPAVAPGGVDICLLKADKGSQAGQYVVLFVIDSVETRDRVYGPPGSPMPERTEALTAVVAKNRTLTTTSTWGDYVVIGGYALADTCTGKVETTIVERWMWRAN